MKDNVLQSIGDILIINVSTKITGKVTFSEYSDVLIGITDTRNVNKEFRISADGIFWSDWKDLTNENLSYDNYISDNSLLIQVKYTRTGTDNTGVVEFQDINFFGSRQEIQFVAPTAASSIFSDFLGTTELRQLEENIFKKLYYRGILPKYITRAENSDEKEDNDFIDLFFSIARFFSLIICFSKSFENFKNDFDLMREQVRQYGLYFDEKNINLDDLQYLASHLYDEIRKRGTEMIFKRKGDVLPNGNIVPIDGEFIRLIRSKKSDEILYENMPLQKVGWCMGQSSPMYQGTAQAYHLNKTKEDTQDFIDLNNFVLNKQGDSSFAITTESDGKKVLNLKSLSGMSGLGRIDDSQEVSNNLYVVDSRMDYEITFAFKLVSGKSSSVEIKFGVEGFDILKNKLNDSFITPNGDSISEVFFDKETTNIKTDCWYFARGIIHSYSSSNLNESVTNLGFGTNLYFNNSFVKYMLPKIQLISNGVSSELHVWDYKIRPLVRGTNIIPLKNGTVNSHSLGFIQSSRFFYSYFRNNNNNQSQDEITDIIEKYLLSYNMTDMFVFMSNY